MPEASVTPPRTTAPKLALAAAALAAAAAQALALALPGGLATAFQSVAWLGAAGLAVAFALLVARRTRVAGLRRSWLLWALGAGTWLAGAALRLAADAAGSHGLEVAADVAWLVFPVVAALSIAFDAPRGSLPFRLFLLDAAPPVLLAALLVRLAYPHPLDDAHAHELLMLAFPVLYLLVTVIGIQTLALERPLRRSPNLWGFGIAQPLLAAGALAWPAGGAFPWEAAWTAGLLAAGMSAFRRLEAPHEQPVLRSLEDRGIRALPPAAALAGLLALAELGAPDYRLLPAAFAVIAGVCFTARALVVQGEHRRAHESLRESEETLRTVVENIPGAVYRCAYSDGWTVDFMGGEVEALTGYRAREFLAGRISWAELEHPDDSAGLDEHIKSRVEAGQPYAHEYRIVRADGEVRWVLDRGQAAYGPDGRPLWLDGVLLEVTEQKRAEQALAAQNERLRELDALKDEFVSLVSHELRTPLTSIRGYLELVLEDEHEIPEEHRGFLAVVQRNADRLLRLVGDLLFVAQVDAGRLAVERDEVDLAEIVTEAVEAAGPAAAKRGISIALHAVPAVLSGDRSRLAQLVDNLLSNALKFSPDGGEVVVRAGARGDRVGLEISDSGIGIPAGEQAQLFDRFFRSSNARRAAIQGTGLGLVIVRAIVDAHGGSVGVESREGAGTTCRVDLPRHAEPARIPPDEPAPAERVTLQEAV